MSDYDFVPDYRAWWNRSDLTESDLVWLMLSISPEDAQKSLNLKNKPNLTDEEMSWKGGFSNYLHGLFNGPWIADSRRQFMEENLWGRGKEDFIVNAYNRAFKFPEPFADFLKSIGGMPDHFNHYKKHDMFRDSLKAWELANIDAEDKAISLLLGIRPEYFQRFCCLAEELKSDEAWESASPDDRNFFLEFRRFNASEFSLDRMQYAGLLEFAKKIKGFGLWGGDFAAYVQAVHDGGFVFKRNTYEALEFHGIRPAYTRNGWARGFYRSWIERGIWRLMDAAFLYIGDDPYGGRSFEGFGETEKSGPGRILQRWDKNAVIFFQFDEKGGLVDTPLSRMDEETSLEGFVKNHIDAGNLTPASTEAGLKFRPIEIVSFFRKYFPLTFEPQALLIELGLESEESSSLQVLEFAGGLQWAQADSGNEAELQPDPLRTGFAGRPAKSRDFMEQEFERRKQRGMVAETLADEARILIAWLKLHHPEMPVPAEKTVKNNLGGKYRQYKNEKQAA